MNQPASFKASRVDPAFTVQYKITDATNVYARVARGYRAGGANVRSSNFASYDEEVNDAIELGVKTRFADNRVQLNAALFQNTIKGEQLTIQEQPLTNPSLTNTVNSGSDKKVKGAEVELTWAVTDGLTLGANYTYMDAIKFKDIDNQLTTAVDLTRFYTVLTPESSGAVFVDFKTPLPIGNLAVHSDYAFSSEYWTTPGAQLVAGFGPTYSRPSTKTSQLGARVSWNDIAVGGGKMELALYGRNLTDDTNYVYGFDGCAFGRGFCEFRTPPRTYGAEVKFAF